jgi:SAM-dependent methyltransferase
MPEGAPEGEKESYIYSASEAAALLFASRSAATHAEYLVPYLNAGMSVVDVGSGGGEITIGLAEAVAPAAVLGIDVDEGAVGRARVLVEGKQLSNVRFETGVAYQIPVPDASVDVVHYHAVLAHRADTRGALLEAKRVLKPGGLIAAREPAKDADLFGGPLEESGSRFNKLIMDDWRLAGGDPLLGRKLKGVVVDAGFNIVSSGAVFDWADVASSAALMVFARTRLAEDALRARVVEAGLVDELTLDWMASCFEVRAGEPDAFYAGAEVEVLARKP